MESRITRGIEHEHTQSAGDFIVPLSLRPNGTQPQTHQMMHTGTPDEGELRDVDLGFGGPDGADVGAHHGHRHQGVQPHRARGQLQSPGGPRPRVEAGWQSNGSWAKRWCGRQYRGFWSERGLGGALSHLQDGPLSSLKSKQKKDCDPSTLAGGMSQRGFGQLQSSGGPRREGEAPPTFFG